MDTSWLDFLPPFFQGLLVSSGIGLIIGLEREHKQQTETLHFAGLRTFPLMSILGFTGAYVADQYLPGLLLAITAGVFLLITVAYFVQARQGNLGMTSELALAMAFILGIMVAYGHSTEALASAVVVTVLLSLKEEFHQFVKQITEPELAAFIKFFVLAVLLLLLLPDRYFGPDNLLHYRELGWIIVLVSSISFVGYLLLKFTGSQRGILLTALLGGLFSSTMIAWVFAARSRQAPGLSRLLGAGILLSSSIMYVRVLLLTWLFNAGVSTQLAVPCALMLVLTLAVVWRMTRAGTTTSSDSAQIPLGNPLDIKNGLFFGLLYIGVSLFMYYSRKWFGEAGSYWSGAVSGIADLDAITISTAKWTRQSASLEYGANLIVVAMLSNTLFKSVVALARGHAAIRRPLAAGFGLVLLTGVVWLFWRLYL